MSTPWLTSLEPTQDPFDAQGVTTRGHYEVPVGIQRPPAKRERGTPAAKIHQADGPVGHPKDQL